MFTLIKGLSVRQTEKWASVRFEEKVYLSGRNLGIGFAQQNCATRIAGFCVDFLAVFKQSTVQSGACKTLKSLSRQLERGCLLLTESCSVQCHRTVDPIQPMPILPSYMDKV